MTGWNPDDYVPRVVVVEPDGTRRLVALEGNTLQLMYRELHCDTVDVVSLPGERASIEPLDMWCDDNGMITGQPMNAFATALADELRGEHWQPYFGTVLYARTDEEGETIGLDVKQTAVLMNARLVKVEAEG